MSSSKTRLSLWFATAGAALVLLTTSAIGEAFATATVSAGAPSGTLSTTTPTVTVPVTISRPDNPSLLGFSVDFTVSSPLTLPSGNGSITIGPFLSASGATATFQVVNHGGGNYTADGVTLGSPCGSTAMSGTLFNIALASASPSGSGTVTITSVSLRDCNNATLASAIGTASTVIVDNTLPVAAVTSPNGGEFWVAGSSHNITWTATDNSAIAAAGIDLEVSTNNGGSWSPVASGLANSGSYAWTVPATLSTQALIRVTARDQYGNSTQDASDAVFTIAGSTTTSVSSSVNPSVFGQGVTFTATVAPAAAGGTVQFKVDGVNFGAPVALVAGSATSGLNSSLSVGTHTVDADYSGNASYAASSGSLGGGQVVNQASSAVAVASDLNPSFVGNLVTFTATVTAVPPGAGIPGGNVQFKIDGLNVGSPVALNGSGQAIYATSSLAAGSHTVAVDYAGSTNFTASSGNLSPNQVVNLNPTTTSVSSSVNPSVFGQGVSFTATVAPPTASGTVQFKIDGVNFGAPVAVVAGSATSGLNSSLSVGTHTVDADYSGDATYAASSGALGGGQVVNRAASAVAVASDLNPSNVGNLVTFTATVTAVPPGAGIPGGNVQFKIDGVNVGSPVALNVGGQATYATSSLASGSHTVDVDYAGSTNFTASSGSLSPNQVVNLNATTTSVSSSVNPSVFGQGVSFTATVAPPSASGTVQFKIDGSNFGAPVPVVAGSATSGSTSALAVGTHTVDALYSGDATYAASNGSLGGGQVVNQAATTTALVVDVNPSVYLDPITLTATVTANTPGSGTPGGTVTFYDGLNPIGSDPVDGLGVAEIVVASLPVGVQSLTAVYGGSASYTGSTSSAVAHEVKAKIVATAGANGSINPPGTTLYSLNATPAFTFAANPGYHVLSVTVDGGAVALTSPYTFGPVSSNHTIDVQFQVNPAVPAISTLVATPIKTGNDNSGITKIRLTWTAVPVGSTVELFRAPYGNYPEYDDGPSAGSVPSVPSDPPLSPWVSVGVQSSGYFDIPATRDFYYYVAIVTDGYGTHSPVSNMTSGTLDYALGDVSNGVTAGHGNNLVNTADLSLLGVAYGSALTLNGPFNYLDVGPTTNFSVDARPTTDNIVNFEDLVMFALNYGAIAGVSAPVEHAPALVDAVSLDAPAAVAPGSDVTARLNATGTGRVHALSAVLTWNPAVVEPVGQGASAFFVEQNGVAFSARPGSVDLAILGGSETGGLTGEGQIASLGFRVLAAGDPRIRIASIDARDGANHAVSVAITSPVESNVAPRVTAIGFASPNPFPRATSLTFTMAKKGTVSLAIYTVTGRHVATLAKGVHEPGEYTVQWDGRDASGAQLAPGIYYANFITDGVRTTRKLSYLR